MSVAVKQFVMDELSELSFAFRQNCALKNGLPDCKKITTKLTEDPPPKEPEMPVVNILNQIPAAPAATNSPSPGATVVAAAKGRLLRRTAPWLATTALAAAGLGGVGGWLMHGTDKPPAVIQQTPATQSEQDRSVLQWLQDNGQHLKPGATWQQQ